MENDITPLAAREAEVAQYEANITMYEAIMATLPNWNDAPAHLLEHRGSANKHQTAATISNLADVELLSKLWYLDDCAASIRSEMVEMAKAKAILAVIQK